MDTRNVSPKEEFKRELQSKSLNNWEEKRMYGQLLRGMTNYRQRKDLGVVTEGISNGANKSVDFCSPGTRSIKQ